MFLGEKSKEEYLILIFFELEINKNEGLQLEDRHLNLNRWMETVRAFPSISFLFLELVKRLLLVLEILAYVCNVTLKLS